MYNNNEVPLECALIVLVAAKVHYTNAEITILFIIRFIYLFIFY